MLDLRVNDGVEFFHQDMRLISISAAPVSQIKSPKATKDRQRFWLLWFFPPSFGDLCLDAAAFCLIKLVDVFELKVAECRFFERRQMFYKRVDQFLVDQPYAFGARLGLTS